MRARLLLVPTVISVFAAVLLVPAEAAITPTVPVTISGAGNAGASSVQVDSSGRAVAVWSEAVDTVTHLFAAERPAGGTWTSPVPLTTGTRSVEGFDFDLNEAGAAAVAFTRFGPADGDKRMAWGIHRAAGAATWDAASVLGGEVDGVPSSMAPSVAVMSDGTASAAFTANLPFEALGYPLAVFGATGGPSGWSDEVKISDTGHIPINGDREYRDAYRPVVAADGNGNAQVLMLMQAKSEAENWTRVWVVRASRTTETGWTTVIPITSIETGEYFEPSALALAGDPGPAGGFAQAWHRAGEVLVSTADQSRTYDLADTGTFLRDLEIRNGVAAVQMGYMGRIDPAYDLVARVGVGIRRPGSAWTDASDPVEDAQYAADRPDLTVHSDGTISAAYDQRSNRDINVSQLAPGATQWTTDRKVSVYPSDSRNDISASIAAGEGAAGVVIWRRNQGSDRYTIEAADFTSDVTQSASPTTTAPTTPTETTSPSESPSTSIAPTITPPATTAPVTAFVKVTAPSVSGKARVGKTLKAKPGTWQPVPTKVAYQWRAGTKNIKKATKAKLKLTAALKGKKVSVRITVSKAGLPSVTTTVKVKGKIRP